MKQLTAVIYEEAFSDGEPAFVARCPELDITSQGKTVDHARAMLQEAVELWLETAGPEEVEQRLSEGGKVVALMPLEVHTATPLAA